MVVETTVPVESGTPAGDPGSSSPGQSQTQPTVAPSQNIPENLRGKTPEQLADMYTNLEKKLGEQSGEVSTVRKMKEDMQIVLQAIGSDPEIYRQVERRVVELQGGALPETRLPGKGDGEAGKKPLKDDSDVRKAEQTRAISEFETKFKLTEIPTEKRADLNKKIAHELSELVDPGGTKSVAQIIADTPVNLLPKYLEKAYWLAQKDALLAGDSSIQDFASIGGMSASSGKSDSEDVLTEHELRIAEKLRVDPKKYAKSKKDIRG